MDSIGGMILVMAVINVIAATAWLVYAIPGLLFGVLRAF